MALQLAARLILEIDIGELLPGAVRHAKCFGAIKTRREVAHIGRWEVGRRGASREMLRRGRRREVSRIAAREEVARIAGYRDLIRSRDQQGAARRTQLPEPHNLAHKMRRESQPFRQIRK
jgi:hypothetical protein